MNTSKFPGSDYLDGVVSNVPEQCIPQFNAFKDFLAKKLYTEATEIVLSLLNDSNFYAKIDLTEFYNSCLTKFDHRLNGLEYAKVMRQLVHWQYSRDPETALKWIDNTSKKLGSRNEQEGKIAIHILRAEVYLLLSRVTEARAILEEVAEQLIDVEAKRGGITYMHAYYYGVRCRYLETQSDYAAFYHEALKYIGCLGKDGFSTALSLDEQRSWAAKMSVAALLGRDVFNFGELLLNTELLGCLKDTPNEYLVELLEAFNRGDIKKYESLREHFLKNEPNLAAAEKDVRKKLLLLTLMELIFHRAQSDRSFTFDEISKVTRVPKDEVEFLVIHALAKGLVKGEIDQVDEKVRFTWLKPRVLDMKQIETMQIKLKQLSGAAAKTSSNASQFKWMPHMGEDDMELIETLDGVQETVPVL